MRPGWRTVDSRWFWALRSPAAVSPLRGPALQAVKRGVPSSFQAAFKASSGGSKARIGVIHNTVNGAAAGFFEFFWLAIFLIAACACPTCVKALKATKPDSLALARAGRGMQQA